MLEVVDSAGTPTAASSSRAIRAWSTRWNIEEDDLEDAIRAAGDYLAHVHLADSSRLQPGTAHTDFAGSFALREICFEGYMAMECGIRGDAGEALPEAVRYLRSLMG